MIKKYIKKIIQGIDLEQNEIIDAMNIIMEGNATNTQIGSFLTALRIKGETIDEITGCAKVMRQKAERISPDVDYCIDTCGTGGDGSKTINISTAAAFVASAGGVAVAKHGNRSVSSMCGSADVLEEMGINILLDPQMVKKSIEEVGIGFMFAPNFHKSMKFAAGPRKELGIRTIFNILGPLTNPAGAKGQLLGVFNPSLTEPIANALLNLGTERALVISGIDGLDEISTFGTTKVSEVIDGRVKNYEIQPEDFGIEKVSVKDLEGKDAKRNAEIIMSIFNGMKGPMTDAVVINSAAALYVGKAVDSIGEGMKMAREIIDSQKALAKVVKMVEFTSIGVNK